jgi:hypothetical protein
MNTRPTLAVVAVFLVLLVTVYVTVGRQPPSQAEGQAELLALKRDEATRLRLSYQGATASLERSAAGAWTLTQLQGRLPDPTLPPGVPPVVTPQAPNVDARARTFLDRLSTLRVESVLLSEPSADPQYGLDSPALEASVQAGGQTYSVAVGRQNPLGNSYYIRRNDRDVVLASRLVVDSVMRAASDLLRDSAAG